MLPKNAFASDAEYISYLRDWFAGQALGFVDDLYPEWQLKAWFGDRTGLMREEIRARAAYAYADAMLAQRERKT